MHSFFSENKIKLWVGKICLRLINGFYPGWVLSFSRNRVLLRSFLEKGNWQAFVFEKFRITKNLPTVEKYAGVAELVDVPDLGSGAVRHGGSSPSARTFSDASSERE